MRTNIILFFIALLLLLWLLVEMFIARRVIYDKIKNSLIFKSKLINITLILTLSTSFLNIIYLISPLRVQEGSEIYAEFLKAMWDPAVDYQSNYFDIVFRHLLRVYYPLLLMILSYPIQNYIIAGVLITICTSVATLLVIEEIGKQLNMDEEVIKGILILYILNSTVIYHFVLVGSDSIFTLFSSIAILALLVLIQPDTNKSRATRLLILFSLTSFFIREVGVVVIFNGVLWGIYIAFLRSRGVRSKLYLQIIIFMIFLGAILGLVLANYIPFIHALMYQLFLAAGTDDNATKILSGQYDIFVYNILSLARWGTVVVLFSTFIQLFIVGIYLALPHPLQAVDSDSYLVQPARDSPAQIADIVQAFVIVYLIVYVFFKRGRLLDRYLLPILPMLHIVLFYKWHDRITRLPPNKFNRFLELLVASTYVVLLVGGLIFYFSN